jgi:tetratricopeptide (TPR) repeat protein
MPGRLNNLGDSFQIRFGHTKDLTDISEAISCLQKAVQLTPEGHADMPAMLNNLGIAFPFVFASNTRDPADAHRAISNYQWSATYFSGPPSIRLNGAKQWAHCSQKSDSHSFQLLEAYRTAIHLISLVAGLEQTIQKRYTNLIDISELSASAAATAFSYGEYELALEWLEQGRCLVWRQLNDLRTPLDDLRMHNPALADDLLRVSRALENAGSQAEVAVFTAETSMMEKMSIQDQASTHIKLAKEWDQLLTKVRAIPTFEDFLRPASCSTLLKHLPDSGPVVVINIHKDRSDALALLSGTKKPLHIALHEFSYEKADKLYHDLKDHLFNSGVQMRGSKPDTRGLHYKSPAVIKDILAQLWTFLVKPILNALGYSVSTLHTFYLV